MHYSRLAQPTVKFIDDYCETYRDFLLAEVHKPRERLKEGDEYKTKPQIGGKIIKKLKEMGFRIKLVLADSEYEESEGNFVSMVSLQSEQLSESKEATLNLANPAKEEMKKHPWWNEGQG